MKKKFVSVSMLAIAGLLSAFPTISRADETFTIGSITVTKPDQGYDQEIELNGAAFDCTNSATSAKTKFDRTYFEARIDEVNAQVQNWMRNGGTWAPVDPPMQQCSFKHTITESKLAKTFTVSNSTYGQGTIASVCDMDLVMNVAFDYNMKVSRANPGMTMVLPTTSATNWKLSFAGNRKCDWTLTFPSASSPTQSATDSIPSTTVAATANKLVGTIDQDFTTLPGVVPAISFSCRVPNSKTLCVEYAYTSKMGVSSGAGVFAGVTGEGVQTDTRIVPAFLIDMPFEVDGDNKTVIPASLHRSLRLPTLNILGVKKFGTLKSVIALTLTKKATSSSTASSPSTASSKLSFSIPTAKKATCAVTGKSGKKTVSLAKGVRTTATGRLATSLTSASVRSKLRLSAGKTTTLTVTCTVGAKKVAKTFRQTLK